MKHVAKKNRLSSLESAFIKVTLKQVIYLFSFLDKLIIHCSVMKIWSSNMNHRQPKFLLHGVSLLFKECKFSLRRRDKNERDKYKRDPEDKSFGDPSRCVSSEFRACTCILRFFFAVIANGPLSFYFFATWLLHNYLKNSTRPKV